MKIFPVPDVMKQSIYELTPRMFTNRGIRLLMLDIDNTVSPYTIHTPTPRMLAWVEQMKAAGLELYILSNNRGDRPEIFAAAFGLPYRKKAWKPFSKIAREVLAETGHTGADTAFIGDQIYTDCACAVRCGAFSVVVHPIEFSNFWLRLRYWLEFPFRWRYLWKHTKK